MCATLGRPLWRVVFLPLFGFPSSGYSFLLAFRLDLFCYNSGGYGKCDPVVSCLPVVFQSSLCPREGGLRILRARCAVGSIPEGLGMMAFSQGPVSIVLFTPKLALHASSCALTTNR